MEKYYLPIGRKLLNLLVHFTAVWTKHFDAMENILLCLPEASDGV
jgi:hypothetical protein